jgi:hypothetical protein
MKKIAIIIAGLFLLIGGVFIGYKIFSPPTSKTTISSQVILTALQKQGFLVSQTYVFNQVVTIDNSSGSEWKDIFWGQKIKASGTIKINSGVDLHKLHDQDVIVTSQKITITLPAIEIQSTEVLGDVMLSNQQGLLKNIFDNDDGYNQAVARLKLEAEKAAVAPELKQEAEENARNEIGRLLKFIDTTREIKIEFNTTNS